MIDVRFVRTHPDAKLPTRGTPEAAGWDVYAVCEKGIMLRPGSYKAIPTGLNCAIPPGVELQIRPRSGLALKHGITVLNAPGTIDSDYTGHLQIILINHGRTTFNINHGDRIAQIVPAPVFPASMGWADAVRVTDRGAGAFGSTGVA